MTGNRYVARGISRFDLGDQSGGLSDFSQAIALRPQNATLYRTRAGGYAAAKQLEAALKDANQALRLDPDDPDSLATRAYIYGQLGNREKAVEDLRYAVRLRPGMKEAADELRRLEAGTGGTATAAASATGPRPSPAGSSDSLSYARMLDDAMAATRGQRHAEAAELVERMIRADPARSEGWSLRGVTRDGRV